MILPFNMLKCIMKIQLTALESRFKYGSRIQCIDKVGGLLVIAFIRLG